MNLPYLSRSLRIVLPCLLILLLPVTTRAVTVAAGWARADVGLHNKGDGIYLGVSNMITWDNPVFDAGYGLEYVQKKGSQPTSFADPVGGFVVDDAAVTLHVLEPSVFLSACVPDLGFVPRVYVGGSIGLKVKESWSDFPGIPSQRYGYKETDAIVHLGASLAVGPVALDVRWSRSLVGQLLIDPNEIVAKSADKSADKATNPLVDVRVPEPGFDTEVVRVGVSVSF